MNATLNGQARTSIATATHKAKAHTDLLIALVWSDAGATELQARLFALGYYADLVDGCPGPRTVGAIASFQRDRGLPVTGYPDPRTVQALRESYAR